MANIRQKEQEVSERTPYKTQWLDSAYQQTLLPNAPWHQMEERISQVLANRVEKQFQKPDRKEALLQLLGQDFTDQYLPNAQRNPGILDSPSVGEEEKIKIMREAQAYLNSQVYKAAKDAGYVHLTTNNSKGLQMQYISENPAADYAAFLQHTFNIFKTGLDRELYRQEQDLTKKKKHQLNLESKFLRKYKIPAPSRGKLLATGHSSVQSSLSGVKKPSTGLIKEMIQKVEGDPPPLWGPQSDEIGKSILAVLQKDPRKFDHVAGRLHGRQLPGSLRSYMWSDVLFKAERKRMKEVVVEKVIRERFAKAVARGIQDLRVSRATSSPINGLIENAVIETYNKTSSLIAYKSPDHMKEAIKTLNVLYVYDRSYEPYLIYWLFPLQIAFPSQQQGNRRDDRGENVIELAMYLDLLNSHNFPNWPTVFGIAEKALTRIRQSDPELYEHLKMISKIHVRVNPKDFLVQLLHQEKAKAEAILNVTPGGAREQEMSTQLLADPLVFIRRWIGEGFVSILDVPSVMYIWDQCFLQSWQSSVIEHFCIALLELLRHRFMEARDYLGMKEVFLKEACKLYTIDLQHAWIHLEQGNDLSEIPHLNRQRPIRYVSIDLQHAWIHLEQGNDSARIPYLNRQRPITPASRMSQSTGGFMSSPSVVGILSPCGIKDVRLKMLIPSEVMQREPWLAHVDPNNLKLSVAAYFGEVRLRSLHSKMPSTVVSTTQDSYGNTIYQINYPEEKFILQDIDLAPYDLAREMGAYPYAILRIDYSFPGKGKQAIPVGWSRIPLFQRQPTQGATSVTSVDINWDLQAGDQTFDLHPGEIPDTLISMLPVTPGEHVQIDEVPIGADGSYYDNKTPPVGGDKTPPGTVLGYNSKLMAVVYDPKNEPASKLPPVAFPPQNPPRDTRPSPSPVVPPRETPQPSPGPAPVPTPRTPAGNSEEPWVPYKPAVAKKNPKPTGLKDTIDLYIDSVRYLPDNASIIKVTGRVLRVGQIEGVRDILVLPDLNSSARSPTFQYRLTINSDKKEAEQGMLAFLRVYTVDPISETIAVIGSCLVPFFESNKKLRVGGHQYRLHNGMPAVNQPGGISAIMSSDLDNVPIVPGCTLLLRIMPHTQEPAPYPQYSSGYFQSESCRPNTSEYRIFRSYQEHMAYPKTVREMIQRIMETENLPSHGKRDADLLDWLTNRLDIKHHLPQGQPADNLSLVQCVRYRLKMGVKAQINQVYGMPEGIYFQCFARVAPGGKVLGMEPTAEGYGGEEKFVSLKHEYTSYQQAQSWEDNPSLLHPFYDPYTCLIIQLFGLEVTYHCKDNHSSAGNVTDVRGRELTLEDEDSIIGWAVVPLFEDNSVLTGTHHVPVFKGKPSPEILRQFTTNSSDLILQEQNWSNRNKYAAGSLRVTLWDAHFEYKEVPELPLYEYMLETVGNLTDYRKVREPTTGKTMQNFILDSLETKYKKQGTNGSVFKKEQGFFKELMERTFYNLMRVCDESSIRTGMLINEPVHEISNNVVCVTSKGSDQPAHTRSLIRDFASRLSIL